MGNEFTKPPKDTMVQWQYRRAPAASPEAGWQDYSPRANAELEEALADAANEPIYTIREDSQMLGDQVLFCGELATRLGGPFVHRNKSTGAQWEIRRCAVNFALVPNGTAAPLPGAPVLPMQTVVALVQAAYGVASSTASSSSSSSASSPEPEPNKALEAEVENGDVHLMGEEPDHTGALRQFAMVPAAAAAGAEVWETSDKSGAKAVYRRVNTELDSTASRKKLANKK